MRRSFPLIALALSLFACADSSTSVGEGRTFGVVLVSIDTLRPDHLGCYGYEPPTSPALDAFCRDAVVFQQAIAHAPSTLPSHASILTSMLPHHHGASWAAKTPLPPEVQTVAEVLSEAGYASAAVTGGGQMDRIFGLDQGFDVYKRYRRQRFATAVNAALPWLQDQAGGKFFLFLHSYEVHHPYTPDPELLSGFDEGYEGDLPDEITLDILREINDGTRQTSDQDLAHIVATYDAEIRSMDLGFGRLVEALQQLGIYDQTLIVFTSDHGEEFGEHDSVGWHSHTLYDELLRVPLIIKFPRSTFAGERVTRQVRSINIAPTILGTLGLPAAPGFSGTDLSPLLRGGDLPSLPAISRRDGQRDNDISSIRTEEWKLYDRDELFNLRLDPGETETVTNPGIESELLNLLEETLAARQAFEAEAVLPEAKTFAELKALGYL